MTGPILVGVDGSETATSAAVVAAQLAKALDAPLRVVCVYEKDDVEVVEVGSDVFRISSEAEANRTAADVAAAVGSGLAVQSAALHGKPAEALVTEAKDVGASVIVVGNPTHAGGEPRPRQHRQLGLASCSVRRLHRQDHLNEFLLPSRRLATV